MDYSHSNAVSGRNVLADIQRAFGPFAKVANCADCRQVLLIPSDWKQTDDRNSLAKMLPKGVGLPAGFADYRAYCERCFALLPVPGKGANRGSNASWRNEPSPWNEYAVRCLEDALELVD